MLRDLAEYLMDGVENVLQDVLEIIALFSFVAFIAAVAIAMGG